MLHEHLDDVVQAELVAQPPQHRHGHDVGRVLEVVEGSSGALVGGAPAVVTGEGPIAERGASLPRCDTS